MIILEIQYNFNGTTGTIATYYANRATAEQMYHTALASAAVSSVYIHSVVMVDVYGTRIKGETYTHSENEVE